MTVSRSWTSENLMMSRPWHIAMTICLAIWTLGEVYEKGLTLDLLGPISALGAAAMLAYDQGYRRGLRNTDMRALVDSEPSNAMGAMVRGMLAHPDVTAVTVTRRREGSGISTYTIAAKRDDQ